MNDKGFEALLAGFEEMDRYRAELRRPIDRGVKDVEAGFFGSGRRTSRNRELSD
ncbi:MAG: hypothetical protein O2780_20260 [Proteobacteria bacterium]|jgi:hypothetical protein|nr:hypothetical protein [Pseudomonadota bacterium]MDA1298800.1 hypothetical protein [Pseudomonadota bacterium]